MRRDAQRPEEPVVIIVAGRLYVDPAVRTAYLASCRGAIEDARVAHGCVDFTLSADPLENDRINVFEQWESEAALHAFRGAGPSDEQATQILRADVSQFRID